MVDPDRLAVLAEQVHDRRAEQPKVARAQQIEQPRDVRIAAHAAQRDVQRQLPAMPGAPREHAQVEVDKVEFVRECEVFGQQPIGRVRAGRIVDQRVGLVESRVLERRLAERDPAAAAIGLDVAGERVREQAISQRGDERLLAVQMRAQLAELQRRKVELRRRRFERDRDHACRVAGQRGRGGRRGDRSVAGVGEPNRRERHVVRGAEPALHASNRAALQLGAALDDLRLGQFGERMRRTELRDRA